MKRSLLLLAFLLPLLSGCTESDALPTALENPITAAEPTMKDDATSCAYWKCSTEKKLYMQKYTKQEGGKYVPAGAFKLEGGGVGAFPLADLDKYASDGETVSWSVGFDPCPYCSNTSLGQCHCKKVMCVPTNASTVTCPWCGKQCGPFTPGDVSVGGGG